LGDSPEPRLRSFDLGISILSDGPIRQVISSLCLTAGGFRFLVPPVPARELSLPYAWLTTIAGRPHRGYCVPHIRDTSGLGALFTAGRSGVLSYRNIACMPFMKEHIVPSPFSQHHRLYYPLSDDQC